MRSSSLPLPNRLRTFLTAGGGPLLFPEGSICTATTACCHPDPQSGKDWSTVLRAMSSHPMPQGPRHFQTHVTGTATRKGMYSERHLDRDAQPTVPQYSLSEETLTPSNSAEKCIMSTSCWGCQSWHEQADHVTMTAHLEAAQLGGPHQLQRRLEHQADRDISALLPQPLHLPPNAARLHISRGYIRVSS